MKINFNKFNLLVIGLISLFFSILLYLVYLKQSKVVFVDNSKLFNEFNMTRDLLKEGKRQMVLMRQSMDSITLILRKTDNENLKKELSHRLIEKQRAIEEFQSNFSDTNSKNVWKRINSHLVEYSKENNYDLIIGSQVNGAFYGNSELDVTQDFLKYINSRYEGFE